MNTQITEDYCSFEVAKLLKEKGFNEYCRTYYTNYRIGFPEIYNSPQLIDNKSLFEMGLGISAPTLQMTMKWLREVHNTCIVIQPYDSYYKERYEFEINKKNNNNFTWKWISDIENIVFDTYEEAVEEAIKYCLTNLIK